MFLLSTDTFWQGITTLGDYRLWLAISGVLITYHIAKKKRKLEYRDIRMLLVMSACAALALILKFIVREPRPCTGLESCPYGYGFPSMHAAVAFSVALLLLFEHRRRWLFLFGLAMAVLISASRVVLGVHTLADVIAGAVLGIVITLAIERVIKAGGRNG